MSKRDKRKQQRRKQHQQATRVARRVQQEQAEALAAQIMEVFKALRAIAADPATSPEAFVEGLERLVGGVAKDLMFDRAPLAFHRGRMLVEGVDAPRVAALVGAVADRTDLNPRCAWVAAGMAVNAELPALADDLLVRNLDESADVVTLLASLRLDVGRVADALELLDDFCARLPAAAQLQVLRADALESVARLELASEDDESCPCGSHQAWASCCRDRERASLDRFTDRSKLYRMRDAVVVFIGSDPQLSAWHDSRIEELLTIAREGAELGPLERLGGDDTLGDLLADDRSPEDAVRRLLAESVWTSGPDSETGDDDVLHSNEEGDSDSILGRMAADGDTPEDLREVAAQWLEHSRFGLWQVADPGAGPGVWLTDTVTKRRVYAAFAPEQLEGLARWSVLLGGLFVVDGVWRAGGAFLALDPATADVVTDLALEMAEMVAYGLAQELGMKGASRPRRRSQTAETPPYGVLVDVADEMEGGVADLHHKVVGVGLARLVGVAEAQRRTPTRMSNRDGEPLEMLTAVVPVGAGAIEKVREELLRRHDFDGDPGEEQVAWLGLEMSAAEASQSLAQAQAYAAENGLAQVVDDPGKPRHWIRGLLRFEDDRVIIEVNSRRRLEGLTRILERHGVSAGAVIERALDPSLDLPGFRGRAIVPTVGSRGAEQVWRRHWVDEPVPALAGESPRRAATDPAGRVRLERLLREFEHGADRARMAGDVGIDVSALRHALGMEDWTDFDDQDEDLGDDFDDDDFDTELIE